ncbi:hypothetical protein Tco_0918877 [Tanacetum coccineum]
MALDTNCRILTCYNLEVTDTFRVSNTLPTVASPTADSPGYVPESDLKEELEEDDEDPEEDPADYPADREDDDDDDDDDEDEDEDEEEEKEHPASADFFPPVHRMTSIHITSS